MDAQENQIIIINHSKPLINEVFIIPNHKMLFRRTWLSDIRVGEQTDMYPYVFILLLPIVQENVLYRAASSV